METVVNGAISELAQHINAQGASEAELFAVFSAVGVERQVSELAALLQSWAQAEQGSSLSDRTVAELYFTLATRSSGAQARELSRTALDWFPAHLAALSLFEELVDPSFTDELCARYQTFIEDAPLHGVPPETRTAVLEKLMRAERQIALDEVGQPPSASTVSEAQPSVLKFALR